MSLRVTRSDRHALPCPTDLAKLRVPGRLSPQEDSEGGGLGPLGDIDNLLQTGDAKGDVLGRHTGIVESVERHLGSRFSQRLRRKGTHHLPWLGLWGGMDTLSHGSHMTLT